jgi:hypothetical protein
MFQLRSSLLLSLAASAALSISSAFGAGTIVPGFNGTLLPGNDDGSTGLVNLGFTANFFGSNYTQLYVNNNGNVTFGEALGTFTPFNLTGATGNPIIAPFFADVDTRTGALTKYGPGTFDGHSGFGVTWNSVGVGYFSQHTDKLNKFQLLLMDRADTGTGNFDIYFNYDQIQWETGDASGGSNGFGGTSARAGYNSGSGEFFEIPGSGIHGGFLDTNLSTGLIHNGNTNVDGRFLFQVRNGQIITPPPPTNGVPDAGSTLALLGMGLLVVAAAKRRLS